MLRLATRGRQTTKEEAVVSGPSCSRELSESKMSTSWFDHLSHLFFFLQFYFECKIYCYHLKDEFVYIYHSPHTAFQDLPDVRKVIIQKVVHDKYVYVGPMCFIPIGLTESITCVCAITTGSMWLPGHQCSRWSGQSPWQRTSFYCYHGYKWTGCQNPAITGGEVPSVLCVPLCTVCIT